MIFDRDCYGSSSHCAATKKSEDKENAHRSSFLQIIAAVIWWTKGIGIEKKIYRLSCAFISTAK